MAAALEEDPKQGAPVDPSVHSWSEGAQTRLTGAIRHAKIQGIGIFALGRAILLRAVAQAEAKVGFATIARHVATCAPKLGLRDIDHVE